LKTKEEKARWAAYMREWARKNPDKVKAIRRATYEKHQDKRKAHMAEYGRAHRADAKRRHALRMQDPVLREKHRKACHYHRARQHLLSRGGITAYFEAEVRAFYEACPPGLTVDHIHPLKHPDLCGLHVPWNLQYLSNADNARKGRKLG
jgi:hypothetical protein